MTARSLQLLTIVSLALLALAIIFLGVAPGRSVTAAPQAVFTVNNTSDQIDANPGNGVCETSTAGQCTLRAAIMEANALPGADTINVPAGTYNLLRPGNDDTAVNGDLDITSTLTINGAGYTTTIVSGQTFITPDRIFDVAPGTPVTISGLEIRSGRATGSGGGINNRGALTLSGVRVYTNTATAGGGGIMNLGGQLTIDNSQILTNTATDGGGIDSFRPLTITNSWLSGNRATGNGGAINNENDSLVLVNSRVENNRAGQFGGALGGTGSYSNIISGTLLKNNRATDSGGAIWLNSGVLKISNSTLEANLANSQGGAIHFYSQMGSADLQDTVLNNNSAQLGGGVHNIANIPITLTRVTLTNNDATNNRGGGIYTSKGQWSIVDSTLAANTALSDGGGLYAISATMMLTRTTVQFNLDNGGGNGRGGGLYIAPGGSLRVYDSQLTSNQARYRGGALYSDQSPVTVLSSTLNLNSISSISGEGGAAYVFLAPLTVENSLLESNAAPTGANFGSGGALSVEGGTLTVLTSTLRFNSARTSGAIGTSGGVDTLIQNSRLLTNTASNDAGAFSVAGPSAVIDSLFAGNTAGDEGGAIAISDGNLSVNRSTFQDNAAGNVGGAISQSSYPLIITDTVFLRNQASSGGAIRSSDSSLRLTGSAVVSNTATTGNGGGLYGGQSNGTIVNSTLSGNRAQGNGGGIYWSAGDVMGLNLFSTTIVGNVADKDADGTGDGGGLDTHPVNIIVNLKNSILTGNSDLSPVTKANECAGLITSGDYNLIGATPGCLIVGTITHNLNGVNPQLGPIADNGGKTLTHALLDGSPARDTIPANLCPATDQRSVTRPQGTACDMGAFEALVLKKVYLPLVLR